MESGNENAKIIEMTSTYKKAKNGGDYCFLLGRTITAGHKSFGSNKTQIQISILKASGALQANDLSQVEKNQSIECLSVFALIVYFVHVNVFVVPYF